MRSLFKIRIEAKKLHRMKKRRKPEENGDRDGKALYKLVSNAGYGKTIENLRNKIDVKLVRNKGHYSKWTSKASYMLHRLFDNIWVVIRKNKVTH